jgi:hypothetical protein
MVFQESRGEAERERDGSTATFTLSSIYLKLCELRRWVCFGCNAERLGE